MKDTHSEKKDYSWLSSAAGLCAALVCYGTLAAVALLSMVGITVEIDEGLMVKLISGLLILALAGMVFSFRAHRNFGPLSLSITSAALLLWVFFVSYSKPLELVGFSALLFAAVWDFRVKKRSCACD